MIREIQADMDNCGHLEEYVNYEHELKSALLEAWKGGRCVVLPYKRHERVYVVDDRVKKGYRTTRLGYYQVYADSAEPRIIAKTTAVEHWYDLSELFPTLEAAKEGVEKMHQKKRELCAKYGRACSECKNGFCNARAEAEAALAGQEGEKA
jgi:hypothetical protein